MWLTLLSITTAISIIMQASADLVPFGKINPHNQDGYVQGPPAPVNTEIELKFSVKDINQDQLSNYLESVSNPSSENYGVFLTKQQIDDIVKNIPGQSIVTKFLTDIGASVTSTSSSGQKIVATASLSAWQAGLTCLFYEYNKPGAETLVRTPVFYVPSEVAGSLSVVAGATEFPLSFFHSGPHTKANIAT